MVLAKPAARFFASSRPVTDVAHSFETNERGAMALVIQLLGLHRRADGAGFSAMLVHRDFWLKIAASITAANEVHLGFHHCEVVLGSALQDEASAEAGDVGHVRHI